MIRRFLISTGLSLAMAIPAMAADLVDATAGSGRAFQLLKAVEAAKMTEALKGAGPYTLFAPTDNEAFIRIEEGGELEQLLLETEKLIPFLNSHVVAGKIMASDLKDGMELTTLQGEKLIVRLADGAMVGQAKVLEADIPADNGVIHLVDNFVVPKP